MVGARKLESGRQLQFPPSIHNPSHRTCLADSCTESVCGTSFRSCGLFFSIFRRCVRFERTQKTSRDAGYFIDCSQERALVRLRRLQRVRLLFALERASAFSRSISEN